MSSKHNWAIISKTSITDAVFAKKNNTPNDISSGGYVFHVCLTCPQCWNFIEIAFVSYGRFLKLLPNCEIKDHDDHSQYWHSPITKIAFFPPSDRCVESILEYFTYFTLWWISHKSCKSEYPPIAGSMISPKNSIDKICFFCELRSICFGPYYIALSPPILSRVWECSGSWSVQYYSYSLPGDQHYILQNMLQCWIPVWMIFGSHPGNNVTKLWFFSIREAGP